MKKLIWALFSIISLANFNSALIAHEDVLLSLKKQYETVLGGYCKCVFSDSAIEYVAHCIQNGYANELMRNSLLHAKKASDPAAKHWQSSRCDYAVLGEYANDPEILRKILREAILLNDSEIIKIMLRNQRTDLSSMLKDSASAVKTWCDSANNNPKNRDCRAMCDGAKQIRQELHKFHKRKQFQSS